MNKKCNYSSVFDYIDSMAGVLIVGLRATLICPSSMMTVTIGVNVFVEVRTINGAVVDMVNVGRYWHCIFLHCDRCRLCFD